MGYPVNNHPSKVGRVKEEKRETARVQSEHC